MTVFKTYEDAMGYYKLKNRYITIIDHPESIEKVSMDEMVVTFIGNGVKKSPGHPSGNQSIERQLTILKLVGQYPYTIPIFRESLDKTIRLLGHYSYIGYTKKVSFSGFVYFEFKMFRLVRP